MKTLTGFSALTCALLSAAPTSAFLDGDTFDIRCLFPDTETVFLSSAGLTIGAGHELICPGDGVCMGNFGNGFLDFIDYGMQ